MSPSERQIAVVICPFFDSFPGRASIVVVVVFASIPCAFLYPLFSLSLYLPYFLSLTHPGWCYCQPHDHDYFQNEFKKELPCISNCMVIGDKRKYLVILISLRVEVSPSCSTYDSVNSEFVLCFWFVFSLRASLLASTVRPLQRSCCPR